MSTFCIQGQCEACGKSPRILRFARAAGGLEVYACAECHGETLDAFDCDDEYQKDVAEYGQDGWSGQQ